ncbi:MAG: pentapeptide repeat-containing protein, partial [Pseudomonadota bacterium]
NFRRAEMQGADLSGAEMQNASCSAATLRGAALQDAIVLCRTIERMTLAEAVGTRETRLPIGLAIPSCLQGPESALSDELGAALDQRSAEAERPGFGTFIVRYSRETYLDMLLCDEGEVPVVFEGVWEAMGDGRWQNYVDGVIHAEGVGEDGEWGDIPAHWVTLPGAPPPEGRPLE